MIVSSYFNKKDNVLMLMTSLSDEGSFIKKEENEVLVYNKKEELIAVNIFDYKKDLNQGVISNDLVMEDISKYFNDINSPFVVGEVLSMTKHPKSDKLNICQVDLGDKQEQIVCGAKNVKEGIKVIVAQVGAVMPNGMKILPSKLISETSNGMICSLLELGLSDQKDQGIAILDDTYKIGQSYV